MQDNLIINNLTSDGKWSLEYSKPPYDFNIVLGSQKTSSSIGLKNFIAGSNQSILSVFGNTFSFIGHLEFSNDNVNWVRDTLANTDFTTGSMTLNPVVLNASNFNFTYACPINYQFMRVVYSGTGTVTIQLTSGNA